MYRSAYYDCRLKCRHTSCLVDFFISMIFPHLVCIDLRITIADKNVDIHLVWWIFFNSMIFPYLVCIDLRNILRLQIKM